jgi:hypothetical protein
VNGLGQPGAVNEPLPKPAAVHDIRAEPIPELPQPASIRIAGRLAANPNRSRLPPVLMLLDPDPERPGARNVHQSPDPANMIVSVSSFIA